MSKNNTQHGEEEPKLGEADRNTPMPRQGLWLCVHHEKDHLTISVCQEAPFAERCIKLKPKLSALLANFIKVQFYRSLLDSAGSHGGYT